MADTGELIKIYGPLAVWCPAFFWLLNWVLTRWTAAMAEQAKADIQTALALNALAAQIEELRKGRGHTGDDPK